MKRPTGVTVIAIYFLVLGLLSFLWSGLVFGFGGLTSMFGSLFGASNIAASGTSSAWSGFLGILAAVVQLVVAMVTITLFIPCIAHVFIIAKERGWKTAAAMAAFIFPIAFAVGGLVRLVMTGLGMGGAL